MIAHTSWTFFPIAILVAAMATYLAYNHPILTVVLIVILSTITDNLSGFLSIPTVIDVGLFNLRLWDPLFSGILVTLFLKLFDYQLIQALLRYYLLLILLFVLLILQLMLNIGVYGINALGEFRTYYSPLLMMPYLAIFMRTTEQRLRMLKVLMILSFSFIAVFLLIGFFDWRFFGSFDGPSLSLARYNISIFNSLSFERVQIKKTSAICAYSIFSWCDGMLCTL